jgi:hypothetical protein
MRKIDRALIAWGKGNMVGQIGPYVFQSGFVFREGVPICARLKDIGGKPFILCRDKSIDGEWLDSLVEPNRHFKNKKWSFVGAGDWTSIQGMFKTLHDAKSSPLKSPLDRLQPISHFRNIGVAINILKQMDVVKKLELCVTDHCDSDEVILGAKFVLEGTAYDATVIGIGVFDDFYAEQYKVFSSIDDAILAKLNSKSDVRLIEIT